MPRCADVCVQNGTCNLEGLKVLDSSPRGGFIVEEKMGRSTCVTVPSRYVAQARDAMSPSGTDLRTCPITHLQVGQMGITMEKDTRPITGADLRMMSRCCASKLLLA
jgi:hypothetical protein